VHAHPSWYTRVSRITEIHIIRIGRPASVTVTSRKSAVRPRTLVSSSTGNAASGYAVRNESRNFETNAPNSLISGWM